MFLRIGLYLDLQGIRTIALLTHVRGPGRALWFRGFELWRHGEDEELWGLVDFGGLEALGRVCGVGALMFGVGIWGGWKRFRTFI